jgi:hypothetical protein
MVNTTSPYDGLGTVKLPRPRAGNKWPLAEAWVALPRLSLNNSRRVVRRKGVGTGKGLCRDVYCQQPLACRPPFSVENFGHADRFFAGVRDGNTEVEVMGLNFF